MTSPVPHPLITLFKMTCSKHQSWCETIGGQSLQASCQDNHHQSADLPEIAVHLIGALTVLSHVQAHKRRPVVPAPIKRCRASLVADAQSGTTSCTTCAAGSIAFGEWVARFYAPVPEPVGLHVLQRNLVPVCGPAAKKQQVSRTSEFAGLSASASKGCLRDGGQQTIPTALNWCCLLWRVPA